MTKYPDSNAAGFNIKDAAWIETLIAAFDAFRAVNQNITVNQAVTFLTIAKESGTTQRNLSQAVALNDGTVSRICALLSERGLGEQKGLEVIEIVPVPGDYRMRGQRVSTKGQSLVNALRRIMTRK